MTQAETTQPIRVAAGIIYRDRQVLITKRFADASFGGLWEFPGGKIDPGERPHDAAIRELREELSVEPCPDCLEPFAFVSRDYPRFHLFMPLFVCRRWDGMLQPREGQEVKWARIETLANFEMPPADQDLAAALRDRL